MLRRLKRWRVGLSIVAAVALLAPFLLRQSASFYTDGRDLRAPRASVGKVLRKVLWEPPRVIDAAVNDPELDDYEPTESPFGDLLVFTRGRPGENADLWCSSRERGRWTPAHPLASINTAADELGAAFSADGAWLYFYSNRPGGLGGYDIWASHRVTGRAASLEDGAAGARAGDGAGDVAAADGWADPVNPGAAINTPWNEMSPALDGRRGALYFTSDRRPGDAGVRPWWSTVRSRLNAADYDVYVAVRSGDPQADFDPTTGFSPSSPFDAVNESPWAEGAVAVSPAGDFLYFSSNRPGGAGGFDLYRVRLAPGEPMVPETLGPTVNTPGDELDPSLAGRGFELYFSRAHGGQEDVFVTVSREVYVETEVGDPYWSLAAILEFLLDLLRRIPPALLIVLVYILLALLLLLILRAVWGERLGALNVLTRCFLLALFVHLLLAIWMNRNEVERLVVEVLDPEETFEAFEVSVGGLPEESVALAIREAVATTTTDAPPPLASRMRSLSPSPSPASSAELASAAALADAVRAPPPDIPLRSVEEPIAAPAPAVEMAVDAPRVSIPETLADPANDPRRPELAARTMRLPALETEAFERPVAKPSMVAPATRRERAAGRPDVERPDLGEEGALFDASKPSKPTLAAATGETSLELADPDPVARELASSAREMPRDPARNGESAPPPALSERAATPPVATSPPASGSGARQLVVSRRSAREPDSPRAASLNATTRWPSPLEKPRLSPGPRPPEGSELASRLRPLAPELGSALERPAVRRLETVSPVPSSGSLTPRIYRMRERSRREEALAETGGSNETEAAVRAGLSWLALHQSPDGRWMLDGYADHLEDPSPRDLRHRSWDGGTVHDSRGGSGTSRAKKGETAATGLALLAFLGHGDTHVADGPYRGAVDRGLRWLLAAQEASGDLRHGGNLYMHSIAAFALCEAYAFTRDPDLREPAQRAINFTVGAQNPSKGGWRYDPYPESSDVDTSVFGWMLMALKSGRLGGLDVDERALVRAASYLDSARMTPSGGRYAYQPGQPRTSLAMTAQGFFSHQMLVDSLLTEEQKNEPELRRADEESISYLMANLPRAADMDGVNFYYWYYATLALFQEGGRPWEIWNARLSDLLVRQQVGEEHGSAYGSWDPRGKRARSGGRVYSTAMSILCLEVYYRYARLRHG